MKFIGIWYNMDEEVKREEVFAKNADEASTKLHQRYPINQWPAPLLSVIPASGGYSGQQKGLIPWSNFFSLQPRLCSWPQSS